MDRDNATWLTHLRGEKPVQQAALSDLREALLRGLRRALLSRSVVDESFLEDAVQDALVRILDRIDQYEGRSAFPTWATSIAIRVAMSELRRKRWKDVSLDDVVTDTDFTAIRTVDNEPLPDRQWEQRDVLETLYRLIDSELTGKQRTALLAELKGMPQEEIARQLGSNRNAVYKLTHDARKRLKRGLDAAGYQAEDIPSAVAN